ncbi:transmembrane protein 272-like [Colossoma macropomum]|uniref:transmembrane protein 272-like n=1 Tax=Colossoma macropomum TaxID=42526 RepID=UPI0018645CC4|nr:transmembrane protein 272-like [Colossoma macropomum]XP_036452569.1 transmembrane protein 272-like [Colossoma macropomum]XP_036452570.1 transmembrane protein 272-like [Colossoma macropomum]XP_036452571.1 transmembrane protein 272-like [Colossoma macropomum]
MNTADVWLRINVVQTMNTSGLLFSKLIMVALPIAQIAMGAVYLQECPKQHYIPIYLLVCGVFSTALGLLTCLPCNKDQGMDLCCCAWNGLVSVFMFCWFISGSVWIYSIYPPNYNSTVVGEPYCNKSLYLFAFWTTTLTYILLAGLLVAACCVLICTCFCRAANHA